ncbi:MAG: helix-turn-helix domain-containing protein [Clostridia bacterium]|nr:helix-turn-helix domain-containing protein [Clostridia bacterium]
MKINIGDRLKQLRLKKGLTQEELAGVFGVSAQAISRWENNTSYPDITLLPGLAIYFHTSVDAIVGMDELCREETLNRIHGEINAYVIDGRIDKAVALIRDSLKIYPNDSGLLMSLGETLAHQKDDPAATHEAIGIAEQILKHSDVCQKAKGTTAANLLFLYLRAGMQDKAESLVRSLPHLWESREILMPELYSNEEYAGELRQCITKILSFLCQKIDSAQGRLSGDTPAYIQLGVDFSPTASVEEMLAQISAFLQA